MATFLKFMRDYGLFLMVIAGLALLGTSILSLIAGNGIIYLTYFFVIIVHLIQIFDFFINTTLLLQMVGWALLAEIAIWSFSAVRMVYEFFKGTH